MLVRTIEAFGKYGLTMRQTFRRPDNFKVFRRQVVDEIVAIGINSLPLIAIVSVFMGAVISLQFSSNTDTPLIPKFTVGFASRQSVIYEFSTTIIALILCGKVGSNISSQLGTMRITEQVDALEVMGINSASFLILPKILAFMIIMPFLVLLSMFLAISGAYLSVVQTGMITPGDFTYGLQLDFQPYDLVYALTKTIVFAFLISSISSFQGFNTRGGAIEVGNSSTNAVVYSIFSVLLSNLVITSLMLL